MSRVCVLLLACLVATLLLTGSERAPGRSLEEAGCQVETAYGTLSGVDQGATCAFLGVPFAASPAGPNRWKPPQPLAPWAPAVRGAATPAPNCPAVQLPAGTLVGQEDCLYLNVWVRNPAPAAPAPVLVWLHTGAFFGASANFAGTNGARLARETGVVVVAPNYRLGPFGFLAHRALESEDAGHPSTGNYGLLDQRAALEWVRDNIAAFGGDPDNVTLAGSSAGGQSVGLHMVAPGSDGLFHRAIVESAYPTSRWTTRDEAIRQGAAFTAGLGCPDPFGSVVLACLRAASVVQVLTALPQATQQIVAQAGRVYWEPIVDGFVIPDQPRTLFELGEFSAVPTLVGANRDEGWGSFIRRSFSAGVNQALYELWVEAEFGWAAPFVLAVYPAAAFSSAEEALARVVGDGQFMCEARRLADLVANDGLEGQGPNEVQGTGQRRKSDVFLYSYEYEIDALSLDHVIHGVESNIVFGNNYVPPVFNPPYTLSAQEDALHAVMAGYWTRFAKTGNPNGEGSPEWPVYRKNHEDHFVIDEVVGAAEDLGGGACWLWSLLSLRSMLGLRAAID
jgi:para-nitrobenzyl esterase